MIVPSSTSSSSRPAGGAGQSAGRDSPLPSLWPGSWALAIALVVLVLGSWEAYWRTREFVPSLSDDGSLWALTRVRVNRQGGDAVVLVGSSRMQMNVHQETFAVTTGWEPALQLAVVSGASVPVLRSLAEDEEFRGTAIVEINPVLFFARTPRIDHEMVDYVEIFEDWSVPKEIEQRLRMILQRNLISRLPKLAPEKLWKKRRRLRGPRPGYNDVVTEDRFRYGDYRKFRDLPNANRRNAKLVAETTPNRLVPASFELRYANVARWVEQIRERGGRVIFVRLPSAIFVRESESRWFPRMEYWDRFADVVSAPTLHYLDYPRLARFNPPDGDHLGKSDAIRFSRVLGEILVRKGLAPGPAKQRGSADVDRD